MLVGQVLRFDSAALGEWMRLVYSEAEVLGKKVPRIKPIPRVAHGASDGNVGVTLFEHVKYVGWRAT